MKKVGTSWVYGADSIAAKQSIICVVPDDRDVHFLVAGPFLLGLKLLADKLQKNADEAGLMTDPLGDLLIPQSDAVWSYGWNFDTDCFMAFRAQQSQVDIQYFAADTKLKIALSANREGAVRRYEFDVKT